MGPREEELVLFIGSEEHVEALGIVEEAVLPVRKRPLVDWQLSDRSGNDYLCAKVLPLITLCTAWGNAEHIRRTGGVKRHLYAERPHCLAITCAVFPSREDLEITLSFDSDYACKTWFKVENLSTSTESLFETARIVCINCRLFKSSYSTCGNESASRFTRPSTSCPGTCTSALPH